MAKDAAFEAWLAEHLKTEYPINQIHHSLRAAWDAATARAAQALQAERERSGGLRDLLYIEHLARARGEHQQEVSLIRHISDTSCEVCHALARTEEEEASG